MTETLSRPTIGDLQERAHGDGHDYVKGSPHIRHHRIRERVISGVHDLVGKVIERNGQCRVLEVGAGHGTFTDHLVAAGAKVEVGDERPQRGGSSAPFPEQSARHRHS
ncbi:hypothetical protein ACFXKI_11720 [Streptomyces mirabilis]|uniref:hypothetical protein n=1 Tax=Streptomyces mirabilis TaxID=68239 RepID=UPI0036CE8A20